MPNVLNVTSQAVARVMPLSPYLVDSLPNRNMPFLQFCQHIKPCGARELTYGSNLVRQPNSKIRHRTV